MEYDAAYEGDILIDNGKISCIDKNIQHPGAKVINLHNQTVLPGLVDGSSHIGLIESGRKFEGDDMDERYSLIIPDLDTMNGIYPWDECFYDALKSGVTTAIVDSGEMNVIGSKSCAVKTKSDVLDKMLLNPFTNLKAAICDEPKKWNQGRQESPLSRMGIVHLLRKTLIDAKKYLEKKKNGKIDYLNYDPRYEAFENVLNGKIPLKITAHKAQDILTAIRIKEEFKIKVIVDYGTEGYMASDELKCADVPVILGSNITDKSSLELLNRRDDAAKILSDAGICTCISTHHPDVPEEMLLFSAGIAARSGMKPIDALKAVTINPARILGIDNRVGSIKEGKDADIAVFNGSPLKSMSRVTMVLINGKIEYER